MRCGKKVKKMNMKVIKKALVLLELLIKMILTFI